MANKDLVVKMTINSNDFDNGLKNAKSSMNKFNADAKGMGASFKNVIGGMTKAFGALGIAVGGAQFFKSFIGSTQTMGDAWNNTMVAAKTSFQVFETAVASGTGTILSNFKESIRAAREFAEAMDAFGSAQISNQYARMEYVTPFQEAMTKYRDMKASGNTTGMAFAASDMQRMLQAYSENSQTLMQKSKEAVTAKLSAYTGGFVNSENVDRYLDQLYLEIVNGVFPPILQDFDNLEVERRKGDYFYNQAKAQMDEKYGQGWRREAEAMKALSQINDETLNEMLGILKTYDQVRNEINSMRRQMNRVVKGETATTPTVTTPTSSPNTRTPVDLIPSLSPLPPIQTMDEGLAIIEKINASMKRQAEIDQENAILMQVGNMLYQQRIDELNAYGNAIGYLGQAFSSLQTIAADDSAWSKFAGTMGGVIGQIVSLISTYTALVGIEAVAESIKAGNGIPFPYNLVLIAAAGAALAGIIATISAQTKSQFAGSYEQGGIVPGSSYTGDRLWARVNSGELIIPYNEWHNSNAGQRDVHFIIEGSQLKGVLDNYDKTSSL